MVTILLTGSTGFVGKNVLESDWFKGYRFITPHRGEKIPDEPVDYIIHSAAEIRNEDPTAQFESNTLFTFNLLRQFKDMDYHHFVYIGSSSEYGRKHHSICELDILEPDTMYEATKGCGSLLCRAFAKTYKKPITILRPFSIFGRYEPESRFIPTLRRSFRNNISVSISPGSHDFIYIKDFIMALYQIMIFPSFGDVVNIGTGLQYTNMEVYQMMMNISGNEVPYTQDNYRTRIYDSNCWVCDPTRSKEVYGIYPKYSLEAGLKEYYNDRA